MAQRLIDADALKEYIDCGHLRNPCEVCFSELDVVNLIDAQPTIDTYPKEVIPHRNYKYLSDYWCECGWHLGKKGDVKYCSECGRKVNWNETETI